MAGLGQLLDGFVDCVEVASLHGLFGFLQGNLDLGGVFVADLVAMLLERLRKDDPAASNVGDWQKTYLEEEVKRELFAFDSQELRQYFSYPNIRQGILELTSNLFGVRDGIVRTPPLDAGLLEGVTRNLIFDVGADLGVPIRAEIMRETDLGELDELFITSTTREIIPVVRVGDQTIGTAFPGPITSRLLHGLRARAQTMTRPVAT